MIRTHVIVGDIVLGEVSFLLFLFFLPVSAEKLFGVDNDEGSHQVITTWGVEFDLAQVESILAPSLASRRGLGWLLYCSLAFPGQFCWRCLPPP